MEKILLPYIQDKEFLSTQFVLDIKNKKKSKSKSVAIFENLNKEIENGNVENPYIESSDFLPKKKKNWNENYLDLLIARVSSAEEFNEQFVYHIFEVTQFVYGKGFRVFKQIMLLLLLLAFAFLGGFISSKVLDSPKIATLENEIINLQNSLAQKELKEKEQAIFSAESEEEKKAYQAFLEKLIIEAEQLLNTLDSSNAQNKNEK